MENKKLKKPGSVKEQFNQGPESGQQQSAPMTKEETIKFYEENLPFMRMQDEYEKLAFSFQERKVANLELQVRELEAIGYLSQWKAGQDEAKRRQEQEEKMKAEVLERQKKITIQQEEQRKQLIKDLKNITINGALRKFTNYTF